MAAGFVLSSTRTPPGSLLRELWAHRQLWAVLSRKDFFVRYRRASFGLLWAVILPLLQAVVLAVVFSHIAKFSVSGSYPVFVFAAMTVWTYFSGTLSTAATAIVDGAALSSRIYFPRALLPLVPVGSGLYGMAITFALLIGMTAAAGPPLGWHTFWLVPGALLTVAVTATLAELAAALHVYFRDIRYLVQAGLMVLFYLTPVFYPLGDAPRALGAFITALPMAGPAELLHAATTRADGAWLVAVGASCGWVLVAGGAALVLHCRWNRVFSDLL